MLPYITTECGFQTLVSNKSYSVEPEHAHYDELLQAVMSGDEQTFLDLFSKELTVSRKFDGTGVVVENGSVLYGGKPLHGVLVDRILGFAEQGLDPQAMVNFLENLMKNPSSRAVKELYAFLEHRKLPITEDGCFISYKSVRSDFLDKYSGTIDNKVGSVVEVQRNQVNDDKNQTCSHGLHVGALEYAGPGGWYNGGTDKVMIVKVSPADAVSVPDDHNAQKLRVCKYEVIGEYEGDLPDHYYETQECDDDDDEDDEDYSWCGDCCEEVDSCMCDEDEDEGEDE